MEVASIIWYLLSAIVASLIGFVLWISNTFKGMDFWMAHGFLFGKRISKLAESIAPRDGGWKQGEKELCTAYGRYIPVGLSKEQFAEQRTFLRKASAHNRKPMSYWGWALLLLFTAAEALGFAFILGAMTTGDVVSANWQVVAGIGTLIVLSGGLVFLMHAAGHQYYRSKLLTHCHEQFDGRTDKNIATTTITLDQDQSIDDASPQHAQIMSRVADPITERGSYGLVWFAGILIVLIVVLSVGLRFYNYDKEQSESIANPAAENVFAGKLPEDVVNPQIRSDEKAGSDIRRSDLMAHSFGFVTLAVIFVMTQIIGIVMSYRRGFPSKGCETAYVNTLGCDTYGEYREHYRPLQELADGRLQELQRVMDKKHSGQKVSSGKGFKDYLLEKAAEDAPVIAPPRDYTVATQDAVTIGCPSCHHKSPVGTKFCGECGTKMVEEKAFCTACGKELMLGAKFCGACGTAQLTTEAA